VIRGLKERLMKTTKIKVNLSEDPLGSVVKGTGIALKKFDYYRPILEDH